MVSYRLSTSSTVSYGIALPAFLVIASFTLATLSFHNAGTSSSLRLTIHQNSQSRYAALKLIYKVKLTFRNNEDCLY